METFGNQQEIPPEQSDIYTFFLPLIDFNYDPRFWRGSFSRERTTLVGGHTFCFLSNIAYNSEFIPTTLRFCLLINADGTMLASDWFPHVFSDTSNSLFWNFTFYERETFQVLPAFRKNESADANPITPNAWSNAEKICPYHPMGLVYLPTFTIPSAPRLFWECILGGFLGSK